VVFRRQGFTPGFFNGDFVRFAVISRASASGTRGGTVLSFAFLTDQFEMLDLRMKSGIDKADSRLETTNEKQRRNNL